MDQDDDLLARLDVVVAGVHWHLRDPADVMARRMLAAVTNPRTDVLGQCTGRKVVGRGRPESVFDVDAVLSAWIRPREPDPRVWSKGVNEGLAEWCPDYDYAVPFSYGLAPRTRGARGAAMGENRSGRTSTGRGRLLTCA